MLHIRVFLSLRMFLVNVLIALVSYYFVMYVTPGPNNAMVLTSGLKFGFSRTIPHISGITIGHILQLILVQYQPTIKAIGQLAGIASGTLVNYFGAKKLVFSE